MAIIQYSVGLAHCGIWRVVLRHCRLDLIRRLDSRCLTNATSPALELFRCFVREHLGITLSLLRV